MKVALKCVAQQVGALLGRARLDAIFRYVASSTAWAGVFVEPNPVLAAELRQAYRPDEEGSKFFCCSLFELH